MDANSEEIVRAIDRLTHIVSQLGSSYDGAWAAQFHHVLVNIPLAEGRRSFDIATAGTEVLNYIKSLEDKLVAKEEYISRLRAMYKEERDANSSDTTG